MKKQLLVISSLIFSIAANAQLSTGGFPLSFNEANINTEITTHEFPLPDWNAFLEKQSKENTINTPNYVAVTTPCSISYPESGTFTYLDNGKKIWKTQVKINGAKGIGLYLDKFNLPKGVELFITNKNKKHILGAYTLNNNNEYNNFAIEPVQGEVADIELNIESFVDVSSIEMHINEIATYFIGISHLDKFSDNTGVFVDRIDRENFGHSSQCNVNAICPLGEKYPLQRQAALQQLLVMGGGVATCSGTMVNVVGNSVNDCKLMYLTAGHCDPRSSKNSSSFSQILLRFNYQTATCESNTSPESNTITGANFVARSYVNSNSPSTIKGDFLLLQLKEKIPASWNVNLAGWNNNPDIAKTTTSPKKFINFSHPNGDVKKVSASTNIKSQNVGATGSHWYTFLQPGEGIIEGGSSGSGLFNGEGQLIGIASTAGPNGVDASCNETHNGNPVASGAYNFINYSKFSYVWDYNVDGGADNTKLKPWLDPNNTGLQVTSIVKSNCEPLYDPNATSIKQTKDELGNYIKIYPTLVTNSVVKVQMNFTESFNLDAKLIDVNGRVINEYVLNNGAKAIYNLNLNDVPNGIYFLCFEGNGAKYYEKVIVNK